MKVSQTVAFLIFNINISKQKFQHLPVFPKNKFNTTFVFTDIILEVHYGSSRGKHRRTRTAFTHQQLQILENTFSKTHYPDVVMREQLAAYINIPESRIQASRKSPIGVLIYTVLSEKISLLRFITIPEYSFSLGLPLYLAVGGTREVEGTSLVSYRYLANIVANYTWALVALSIRAPTKR